MNPIHSHKIIEPKILYFGTPVVLVSTLQEDGTPNLSPTSSAWALGWTVLLGFEESAKGKANLERTGECVLNVPDADLWQNVEQLAPLTGNNPVPPHKADKFRYCADKFSAAKLTHTPSDSVAPPRDSRGLLQSLTCSTTPPAKSPSAASPALTRRKNCPAKVSNASGRR